jgi:tRNA pseudouridine synthase 10
LKNKISPSSRRISGILKVAATILEDHCLCDNCLGRQFGNLAYGLSNAERGRALKNTLTLEAYSMLSEGNERGEKILKNLACQGMFDVANSTLLKMGIETSKTMYSSCELCKGKLQDAEKLAKLALRKVRGYQFDKFLVGAKIPEEVVEMEDSLRAAYEIGWGEAIKGEFTREIGKIISKKTGKNVEYKNPEVSITVSPFEGAVNFHVNPIFIEGRYRKVISGIPQTRWLCRKCKGKGCELCNGTGKKYPESVQEIIAEPILKISGGTDTNFHGGGREDIDARVLGSGRPFVLEVKYPKKRTFNLEKIVDAINRSGKVEVDELIFVDREAVRRVKENEGKEKIYRTVVESEKRVTKKELEALEKVFTGVTIQQSTPLRVLHRRADKVRIKNVYAVKAKRLSPKRFELTLRCQGGLYVKELVSGDEGRTTPNIADFLKIKVKCISLCVLDIK